MHSSSIMMAPVDMAAFVLDEVSEACESKAAKEERWKREWSQKNGRGVTKSVKKKRPRKRKITALINAPTALGSKLHFGLSTGMHLLGDALPDPLHLLGDDTNKVDCDNIAAREKYDNVFGGEGEEGEDEQDYVYEIITVPPGIASFEEWTISIEGNAMDIKCPEYATSGSKLELYVNDEDWVVVEINAVTDEEAAAYEQLKGSKVHLGMAVGLEEFAALDGEERAGHQREHRYKLEVSC
jgi:hypothetical protein